MRLVRLTWGSGHGGLPYLSPSLLLLAVLAIAAPSLTRGNACSSSQSEGVSQRDATRQATALSPPRAGARAVFGAVEESVLPSPPDGVWRQAREDAAPAFGSRSPAELSSAFSPHPQTF